MYEIEYILCQAVDKGVKFEGFATFTKFKGIQVGAADYRYHGAVHEMGRLWAYPREWDAAPLECDFVYFGICYEKIGYFIVKFKNKLGLYIVNDERLGECEATKRYCSYLETLTSLGLGIDTLLNHRLHDHLQTDKYYSDLTAQIDIDVFALLRGNFNGGANLKERANAYMDTIEEDAEWNPLLMVHFVKGKRDILKILSTPRAISATDWIENFKKGVFWTLSIPTFPKLFIEIP